MPSSEKKIADFKLPLEEIVEATNNFAVENLIGQGGFGKVYKGNLLVSGKPTNIAARKLHYEYGQGDLEFWNEITMLASLKHDQNLVSFIGFCNENEEKIIINIHEVNGSLEKYLSSPALTWRQRLQICVGVARALNYIHCGDGHESSVIHRNIKSSKILLDENWQPKLSGFGHSKTNTKARRHRLVLAEIVGTIGYVDPTYEKTGFVNHKSDVYSFGVVLFELVCGRRALILDEREQYPPQFFSEQDHKDGKKDVMGELDEIADPTSMSGMAAPISGQPVSMSGMTVGRNPSSFVGRNPSSFLESVDGTSKPSSFASLMFQNIALPTSIIALEEQLFGDKLWAPDNREQPAKVPMPSPENVVVLPKKFVLEPLYTMKRLDHYLRTPNEELLVQLAKSHYEEENLDDIIDPDLWKQMDPMSFKIFSETAYNCLKDKRAQRPNIDQILRNLEKALKFQMSSENPGGTVVCGEVEGIPVDHRKGRHLEHLKIPLVDIEIATKKFTERYLGSGAYGKVYRGELELPFEDKDKGEISRKWRSVAIKCIRGDEHGKEGFDVEIELLTSCKHTNIVSLLGFCDEGPNMILVYEHVSNRSLDNYMGSNDSSTNLTWVQRLKISIDIARGLNYLHTRVEDEQRIIHRDIKSGNILLGKNWVAKIADFGLSRFYHTNEQAETLYTENVAGTKEYLCPEYMKTGRLKRAIDIYSFGVVLFEILSGKLANNPIYVAEDENGIAHVARRHFQDRTIHKMVDPRIMEEVDELTSTLHKGPNQDSLKTYVEIAFRCVATTQDDRPTAKDILEELEKALSLQENNKDNLQMSFEEIMLATQNFNRKNLIGGGGFGKVFKGEVIRGKGSTTIVAKRLDRRQGQGENQFLMELEILFEYKHENIIGLEGYCNESNEKIIVYEYASNRSLDRYLNDVTLTWTKRLKICIDIVCGLAFLHGGAPTKEMVIHRDIKCANILLNADWKAKISDFGLSAITAINQEVVSKLVGTIGYVDPQYEVTGFFTEKSDIYSLGVVLFEIMYGQVLVPRTKDYNQHRVTRILKHIHDERKLESIMFKGIKEQIATDSLSTFRVIVSQCLYIDAKIRPTAEKVLQQLEKALEFQEDYEIWGPKLPQDYKEILKLCKYSRNSSEKKKDLYHLFSKGILLQDDKWFSLGSNGERNEMISATTFSYRDLSPHDGWCIVSKSRFNKVAEMLDISNLMIEIETRTQFLSPNTVYGVYLVFKFCDSRNVSRNPMYVDLKYRVQNKTIHAYFAEWRDDEWMMIEFYRFLNEKEDVVVKVLLESLSPYYYKDHDAIYVEGIEFRAIDNASLVGHGETKIQQVMKSKSNIEQEPQLPTESEEVYKRSKRYYLRGKHIYEKIKTKALLHLNEFSLNDEQSFPLSEVNVKKHLMLSAKEALYNFSDMKLFISIPLSESSLQEVLVLQPQLIFRISCIIKIQMLSPDTEYMCYLVFKLSENYQGLDCPVEVRNLLQKSKVAQIVYFKSPSPWNIHDITQVPKQREDGWMEVNIWKFNSSRELKNDSILVNLKLLSYEGTMSGLIVCGLEFRPM